jgi:hypothetical protein
MTALAQNSPPYFHPGPQATRRALKILRGVHIYAGALCAMHNDRLMPYPPGGYRSATSVGRTVLQGGPLDALRKTRAANWPDSSSSNPNPAERHIGPPVIRSVVVSSKSAGMVGVSRNVAGSASP